MLQSDIQGVTRLAVEATVAAADLVEQMHRNISRVPWLFGTVPPGRTGGLSGLVYRNIRSVTGLVGNGLDRLLGALNPWLKEVDTVGGSTARDAVVAALNGVLGDYLVATGNPLATPMELRREGRPLSEPPPGGRVLLLVHGLCMNDRQWLRRGHDHGAALGEALGYTPVYLRYNTGLHVSINGRELAERLERWHRGAAEPITELAILGYSLGGLVARSACHYGALAGHRWPDSLKRLVFLGTPHLGAALERGGNWLHMTLGLSPYSAPLAALGRIRSCGITDLRHGSMLDEDWQGVDRFARGPNLPRPVPLPDHVHCAALAGSTGKQAGDLGDRVLGDGLVAVASALGQHPDPERVLSFAVEQRWVGYGIHHLDLLSRAEVFEALREILATPL